jgi:hypothetical protein
MYSPSSAHWSAIKLILWYLNDSPSQGLALNLIFSLSLHVYCDADWARCPNDCRSTIDFCVYLSGNLISQSYKKQPIVAHSNTNAEYRSIITVSVKLVWLYYLLTKLNVILPSSPTSWCDNISATYLASNLMFHVKTKHIEIDFHFIRECVLSQ